MCNCEVELDKEGETKTGLEVDKRQEVLEKSTLVPSRLYAVVRTDQDQLIVKTRKESSATSTSMRRRDLSATRAADGRKERCNVEGWSFGGVSTRGR